MTRKPGRKIEKKMRKRVAPKKNSMKKMTLKPAIGIPLLKLGADYKVQGKRGK